MAEHARERSVIRIDLGDEVYCDACGADFTESPESGGFQFGSYCYCPACAKENEERIKNYGEEHFIRSRCPEGKSFADWVRQDLRHGESGSIFCSSF